MNFSNILSVNKRIVCFFIVFSTCLFSSWAINPGGGYRIKTIVIDAGHGGKDPGNLGTGRYKVTEKNIALEVALKLGELIKTEFPEINVIYTRDKDVFIGLDERARIANDAKADLFISIHCNAAKNLGANGPETFVLGLHKTEENLLIAQQENSVIFMEDDYETKYEGFDPNSTESIIALTMMQSAFLNQSIEISANVQQEFVKSVHREDRGVKQAGFLVLRKTTMPAILVELGFLTNKEDEDFLVSVNGKAKMAGVIFSALKKYKNKHETAETGISASEFEKGITAEQIKAETEQKEKAAADEKAVSPEARAAAEKKAKQEADEKAAAAEKKAKQDADAKADAKAKADAEKKAKADAELKAKQDAEAKAKAFEELTAKLNADKKAKEAAAAAAAKPESEKLAELKAIKEKDTREQKAKEEAEAKAKNDEEVKKMIDEEKKRLEKEQLLAEFNQRMKEKEELEALKKKQDEELQRIKEAADRNAELEVKTAEAAEAAEAAAVAVAEKKAKQEADEKAAAVAAAEKKAKQEADEKAAAAAKEAAVAAAAAEKKAKQEADEKAAAAAKVAAAAAEKKAKQEADEKAAAAVAAAAAEKKAKQEADEKAAAAVAAAAAEKAKAEAAQKNKEEFELEEKAKQEAIAKKKSEEVAELEREVMLAKKEELLRKIKESLDNQPGTNEVKTSPKTETKKTEVKEQVKTEKIKTETPPENKPKEATATEKLIFRVQFFSSPNSFPLSSPKFSGIENVFVYQGGGLFKYASGDFNSIEAATNHQAKIRKLGYPDAFVVAFMNGERIDMAKAREILNK